MKVVFLTPGTGGWYCGACMRDNTLAKALCVAGHEALLVPLYLPLHLDDSVVTTSADLPVRFGGINLFLQGRVPWLRKAPAWLRNRLDHPALLRIASRFASMTTPDALGEVTLAMLRMDGDGMRREMKSLCEWLVREKADVICLSTALQAGMIGMLKESTGAKVLCCFQGEDGFLDSLPAPWSGRCWSAMAAAIASADMRIAPSTCYAGLMRDRLGDDIGPVHVLPNGVDVNAFQTGTNKNPPPVIGYLARMCAAKGLDLMVDAFIRLRGLPGSPPARLHLAGTATAEDLPLIRKLKQRIAQAGLESSVVWSPDISRDGKLAMLGSLSLFSVPVRVPEAFGLYAIEAMAAGVPVVLPDASAFPEIIGDSGAGVLFAPGDPEALAEAWRNLLGDAGLLEEMSRNSRKAAEQRHDVRLMAQRFVGLLE
jgi:glycosyltransferase involved in cell wall biosynthesis